MLYCFRIRTYYTLPNVDKLLREKYPELATMSYIGDIEKQTSLFLVNTDVSIDYPEPYSPNGKFQNIFQYFESLW
jgi:hypothetical protein